MWIPKPYRPSDPPSVEMLKRLSQHLTHADDVEDSTKALLLALCRKDPGSRLKNALDTVTNSLRFDRRRAQQLSHLLSPEELQAYMDITRCRMHPDIKHVVEQLLCVDERHVCAAFYRRAFEQFEGHSNQILQ